jgi:diaminopimelate epimerase
MNRVIDNIAHRLYLPGGNMTALVLRLERDAAKRVEIQNILMDLHRDVEQVGFVGHCANAAGRYECPELIMTGGEFCGNAARAAAFYYLGGKTGEIALRVSGAAGVLQAGIDGLGETWVEMPVKGCKITKVGGGATLVEMDGISHLVLSARATAEYSAFFHGEIDKAECLGLADVLLRRHMIEVSRNSANGVIFTEVSDGGQIKIHPCVFVKSAATAFYETACGSGSVAAVIAERAGRGENAVLQIVQPSGTTIETSVVFDGADVISAKIKGKVTELTRVRESE